MKEAAKTDFKQGRSQMEALNDFSYDMKTFFYPKGLPGGEIDTDKGRVCNTGRDGHMGGHSRGKLWGQVPHVDI